MRKTSRALVSSIAIILSGASFAAADLTKMNPDSMEHFPMADQNSDEKLSLEEFKIFVNLEAEDDIGKSRNLKRFKMYKTGYSQMDGNKDGALTLEEIAAFKAGN